VRGLNRVSAGSSTCSCSDASGASAKVSRLFGAHLNGAPLLKIVVLVLVLLLVLYAFYWAFRRFISVIRWALDRIAYALGVILLTAAVVSGVFASAGLVAAVVIWTMSNINLASR
jgi:hypothetical protein